MVLQTRSAKNYFRDIIAQVLFWQDHADTAFLETRMVGSLEVEVIVAHIISNLFEAVTFSFRLFFLEINFFWAGTRRFGW